MHISLALLAGVSLAGLAIHAQPPVAPDSTPLTFHDSKWIWTSEMATGSAPQGTRPFRKAFMAPEGKTPVSAHILAVSDDSHTLYVNGRQVSYGGYGDVTRDCVVLNPCLNVFAFNAVNIPAGLGPAGLLATIRVTYADGTTTTLSTDSSWKVGTGDTPGFEALSFDDNGWTLASIDANTPSFWVPFTTATLQPDLVKCAGLPDETLCTCGRVCPTIKSEVECTGDNKYLSAVPGKGCICENTNNANYCGVPIGPDHAAVQMCIDRPDGAGNHDAKCYVKCSPGFTPNGQNTCVPDDAGKPPGGTVCPAGCTASCAIQPATTVTATVPTTVTETVPTTVTAPPTTVTATVTVAPTVPTESTIAGAPQRAEAGSALAAEIYSKMPVDNRCPQNLGFIKTDYGYVCTGGNHRITWAQLGIQS